MRFPWARFACLVAALVAAPACNLIFGISEGAPESTGGSATSADSGNDTSTPAPPVTLDPGFPKVATISGTSGAASTTALSTTFDVPSGGRMVVAVVVWGQWGGAGVWPVTVTGGGLSWTSAAQTVSVVMFPNAVGVGIWTAWVSAATPGVTVTATRSNSVPADAILAVYSLGGASSTIGTTGITNGFPNDVPLSVSLPTVAAGSFAVLGLLDGNGMSGIRGKTLATTIYDATLASGSGNGLAVGHLRAAPTVAAQLTVGQDVALQYDVGAAVEIRTH
jgi:hypothetical protein